MTTQFGEKEEVVVAARFGVREGRIGGEIWVDGEE